MSRTRHDRTTHTALTTRTWQRPQAPGRDGFPHHTVVGELMTSPVAETGLMRALVKAVTALRGLRRLDARAALHSPVPAAARTVNADDCAAETAWQAVRDNIDRFDVVDSGGHLVGVLRLHDLLAAVCREDDAIRSEVLYIAAAQVMEVERPGLLVDCRQGRVTLRATTTWRSQAQTLLARVRAVEGIAELQHDLSWELDDTSATTPTQRT